MTITFSSRFLKIFIVTLLILGVGYAARILFFPANENEKIEKMLQATASAFAEKKFKAVAEFLSDDFVAEPRADKEMAVMQMKGFFFQVRDLKASIELIKHENEKLPATATEARALVVVKVAGSIDGNKFQAFGQHGADAALLSLRRIDSEWRISRARYLDASDPLKAFQELHR